MTELNVFKESLSSAPQLSTELMLEIGELLAESGIRYQKLETYLNFSPDMSPRAIEEKLKQDLSELDALSTYAVTRLVVVDDNHGSQSTPIKYLSEHQKEQPEAYLIVDGYCQFSLHIDDQVLQLRCEKGDYIEIPSEVKRWLDFGLEANVSMLKFSHQEDDAITLYTGDKIADSFPRLHVS